MYRGNARAVLAGEAAPVHQLLRDSIGMLYDFRKDRKPIGRFVLDYFLHRPLRGEAFLGRVLFD